MSRATKGRPAAARFALTHALGLLMGRFPPVCVHRRGRLSAGGVAKARCTRRWRASGLLGRGPSAPRASRSSGRRSLGLPSGWNQGDAWVGGWVGVGRGGGNSRKGNHPGRKGKPEIQSPLRKLAQSDWEGPLRGGRKAQRRHTTTHGSAPASRARAVPLPSASGRARRRRRCWRPGGSGRGRRWWGPAAGWRGGRANG